MNQSPSSVPRSLRKAAQLLMVFSLLLALMAPLLQSPMASRAAGDPTIAGEEPRPSLEPDPAELPPDNGDLPIEGEPSDDLPPVEEPPVEEPPVEEPPVEEEPSEEEPSEEPSVEPTAATGSVTIALWECPAGYEVSGIEGELAADCTTPIDGVQFDLSQADTGVALTQSTGETGISGTVKFPELAPGILDVTQYLPAGIVDTISIGCTIEGFPTLIDPGGTTSTIQVDLAEGESLTCDWYDIPEGDATDSSVTIYKWLCPAGYDYQADGASPVVDCAEAVDGVEFTLTGPASGDTSSATTGDPDSGSATFGGLAPGDYQLGETNSPQPYEGSLVRCAGENEYVFDLQSFALGDQLPFTVNEDGLFESSLFQGMSEVFNCDWYNIPGGNSLTITKWLCPAGYDYTDPESRPDEDCTEPLDDIDFELTPVGLNTTSVTATTGDPDPGIAVFTGFEPGSYELIELASPYEADGFRVCDDVGSGNPGAEPTTVGEPFAFEVEAGQPFDGACDWYNIDTSVGTGDTDNAITIYTYLCPDGYDEEADGANPAVDCAETVVGAQFTVSGPTPGNERSASTGDADPSWLTFGSLPAGDYQLGETDAPQPFDRYLVRCAGENEYLFDYQSYAPGDQLPFSVNEDGRFESSLYQGATEALICDWYHIPAADDTDDTDGNSITIHKWSCPVGYDPTLGLSDPYVDCTEVTNGVEFTVNNLESTATGATGNDGPGTVVFDGLTPATWTIEETPPTGYMAVLTGDCYERDSPPSGTYTYGEGDFTSEVDIPVGESTHLVCHWFNIYADDPGDVLIFKWTCPEGYDIYAYGANAAEDCTESTNGVQFNAEGPGYTSQSATGDSLEGAVMFGGLEPGDYTFTETLPEDTLYVFIADCTGTSVDVVHPYPLFVGNPLLVKVNPGDRIVCNWYNVPRPTGGTIVLTKYICSTSTYTAAVNCEVYEGGATFTLLTRQGDDFADVSDGTTGTNGQVSWMSLQSGLYTVQEEDNSSCRITASRIDGGYIGVIDGETTYVTVYNCTSKASPSAGASRPSTKPSNAPPGKFPNTGTDPNAAAGPATGALAEEPSPSPDSQINAIGNQVDGQVDDQASDDASGSAEPSGCPILTDPNETISPSPSASESASPSPSPSEQEVTAASLAPSPDAGEESCDRGEVPASIVAEAGGIDLDIEVIETVDGEMQAPTGAEDAAWYRETSRLGEDGPIVVAGHLNYWNVPEGPFYGLAELAAGDVITVTGDGGGHYRYEVQSTEQFPSDASPNDLFESVDDSAGGETIILITCGGEWDASVSEYNERTVVVATRVAAGDEGS